MNCPKVFENGCRILRDYVEKNKLQALVIGESGGLDSAVNTAFASKAGVPVYACILPCESSQNSIWFADLVIKKFKVNRVYQDLTNGYRSLLQCVFKDSNLSPLQRGNLKARLRMIYLYNLASEMRGMVLSTDNLSELLLGFWSLHGDIGDFGATQNLWKGTEMYELAEYVGVPAEVIQAAPSDDLGVTEANTDEAQLGAPYVVVDGVMKSLISRGFDTEGELEQLEGLEGLELKIASRCLLSAYKRKGCINITRTELGLEEVS